jgi:hypothetical protein
MKCDDLRNRIPDFLSGQLTPKTAGEFDEHLGQCPECRDELEHMKAVWEKLGDLPELEPGPGLRGRFYAMLEEEKRRVAQHDDVPLLRRFEDWVGSWWPRRPIAQMLGAVVVLAVGLAVGARLEPAPAGDGEVAHLRNEVEELQQMVSLSLLDQESTTDRLRGVNWSTKVEDPSRELLANLIRTLETDPNVNVRLAAVDALAVFRNEPGVTDALTSALSRESSPSVQVALVDLMKSIQDRKALDALKNFIEMRDLDPEVKEHAQEQISDFM